MPKISQMSPGIPNNDAIFPFVTDSFLNEICSPLDIVNANSYFFSFQPSDDFTPGFFNLNYRNTDSELDVPFEIGVGNFSAWFGFNLTSSPIHNELLNGHYFYFDGRPGYSDNWFALYDAAGSYRAHSFGLAGEYQAVSGVAWGADGNIYASGLTFVGGIRDGNWTQVVGYQQPAIPDATSTGDVINHFNDLLAALRIHGLIAT